MNRTKNWTTIVSAAALVSWGCGGILSTGGNADGSTDDTDTDMAADMTTDVNDDAIPDIVTDDETDTMGDTTSDVEYDTLEDSAIDTAIDTTIDTVLDTGVDTSIDTTPVDTGVDTSIDTTPVDTGVDTSIDTTPVDTGVDTSIDTAPVDSWTCVPDTEQCSSSGDYQVCRSDGSGYDTTPCTYGCLDTPTPHCGVWDVSNIGSDIVDDGTGALDPTDGDPTVDYVNINTDTGQISYCNPGSCWEHRPAGTGLDATSGIHYEVVSQGVSDAPDIGVFSVTEGDIADGVTVWVTGDNAFALASTRAITISGLFNCKAFFDGSTMDKYPGPGGGDTGTGPGAGDNGTEGSGAVDGGGGGAGFGGAGGDSGPGSSGGAGGTTYGSDPLVPLYGGSGGGNGADNPGYGGPGGGACMFVSFLSITVTATGGVDAAGHGGDGGGAQGGGGGAGSGGGLLFEAPTITIDGLVVSNGGGGGSGAVTTSTAGNDGERGHYDVDAALGGVSYHPDWWVDEDGCDGGNGNSSSAIDGLDNVCVNEFMDDDNDGGGGGGGAGRLRFNAMTHNLGGATLSPETTTTAASQADLPIS